MSFFIPMSVGWDEMPDIEVIFSRDKPDPVERADLGDSPVGLVQIKGLRITQIRHALFPALQAQLMQYRYRNNGQRSAGPGADIGNRGPLVAPLAEERLRGHEHPLRRRPVIARRGLAAGSDSHAGYSILDAQRASGGRSRGTGGPAARESAGGRLSLVRAMVSRWPGRSAGLCCRWLSPRSGWCRSPGPARSGPARRS